MKILSGIVRCLEKLTIIGVCRYVESIMQNVTIKDVVSGPIRTLSRLLNVLNVRRDFLSIDPKVVKAETQLAELHQILLLKRDSHGLNNDDEAWFENTRKYFDRRKDQLDIAAITLGIALSRLTEKPFMSTVTEQQLTLGTLQYAKKILDNSKK